MAGVKSKDILKPKSKWIMTAIVALAVLAMVAAVYSPTSDAAARWYCVENGSMAQSPASTTEYSSDQAAMTINANGWHYFIPSNTTATAPVTARNINVDSITVSGGSTANIILWSSSVWTFTLTVTNGITVANGSTLNIYVQPIDRTASTVRIGDAKIITPSIQLNGTAKLKNVGTIEVGNLFFSDNNNAAITANGTLNNYGIITNTSSGNGVTLTGDKGGIATVNNYGIFGTNVASTSISTLGGQIYASTNGINVMASGGNITNDGVIQGGTYGINATPNVTVINNAAGTIQGNTTGINLAAGGTVTNSGLITGVSDIGIYTNGPNTQITNNNSPGGGVISGGTKGISVTAAAAGTTITNTGNIGGSQIGIDAQANVTVTNTDGEIHGDSTAGINLAVGGTVTNTGVIASLNGNGIYSNGANTNITNNVGSTVPLGSIQGGNSGIYLNAGGDVNNYALITGVSQGVYLPVGGNVNNQTSGLIYAAGGTMPASVGVSYGVNETIVNYGTIMGDENGIRFARGGTVTNYGSITGTIGYGIFSPMSIVETMTVTNYNTITGKSIGIYLSAGGTVTNKPGGTITGTDNYGIVSDKDVWVINDGTIDGSSGIILTGGSVNKIDNTGDIIATGKQGISVINSTTNVEITNSGQIKGASEGISINGDGIINNNSGTIIGGTAAISTAATSNSINILNDGLIEGNNSGIYLLGTQSTIENRDTINGIGGIGISSAGGPTVLLNDGTITGDVTLLSGVVNNVTFITGSEIDGNFDIGDGNSTLDFPGAPDINLKYSTVTGTTKIYLNTTVTFGNGWTSPPAIGLDDKIILIKGTTGGSMATYRYVSYTFNGEEFTILAANSKTDLIAKLTYVTADYVLIDGSQEQAPNQVFTLSQADFDNMGTFILDNTGSPNNGWYYITENVTLSNSITMSGDVSLIVRDSCTVTVTSGNGVEVPAGSSAAVYANTRAGVDAGDIGVVTSTAAGAYGVNAAGNVINTASINIPSSTNGAVVSMGINASSQIDIINGVTGIIQGRGGINLTVGGMVDNYGIIKADMGAGTGAGIQIGGNATVTNEEGGKILGSTGIYCISGNVEIDNSGTIDGTDGIRLITTSVCTITNNKTGIIKQSAGTGTSNAICYSQSATGNIYNYGQILAEKGPAIFIDTSYATTAVNTFNYVNADGTRALIKGPYAIQYINSSRGDIYNEADVQSSTGYAIQSSYSGSKITNALGGKLTGTGGISTSGVSVINAGDIIANGTPGGNPSIGIISLGNVSIENSGNITAGLYGITLSGGTVKNTSAGNITVSGAYNSNMIGIRGTNGETIINDGRIDVTTTGSVNAIGIRLQAGGNITNNNVISGGNYGVWSVGTVKLSNYDSIIGNVTLDNVANDVVFGAGSSITGNFTMGTGGGTLKFTDPSGSLTTSALKYSTVSGVANIGSALVSFDGLPSDYDLRTIVLIDANTVVNTANAYRYGTYSTVSPDPVYDFVVLSQPERLIAVIEEEIPYVDVDGNTQTHTAIYIDNIFFERSSGNGILYDTNTGGTDGTWYYVPEGTEIDLTGLAIRDLAASNSVSIIIGNDGVLSLADFVNVFTDTFSIYSQPEGTGAIGILNNNINSRINLPNGCEFTNTAYIYRQPIGSAQTESVIGNGVVTVTNGVTGVIKGGQAISLTGGGSVYNYGDIIGDLYDGVYVGYGITNIINSQTSPGGGSGPGTISGKNSGISIIANGNSSVINDGTIVGLGTSGIAFMGYSDSIIEITNKGTIEGESSGINMNTGTVHNSNTISGTGLGSTGIICNGTLTALGSEIFNETGSSVISGVGAGVIMYNGGTAVNNGSIIGTANGLFATAYVDLSNYGSIKGNVSLANVANDVTFGVGSSIEGNFNMGTAGGTLDFVGQLVDGVLTYATVTGASNIPQSTTVSFGNDWDNGTVTAPTLNAKEVIILIDGSPSGTVSDYSSTYTPNGSPIDYQIFTRAYPAGTTILDQLIAYPGTMIILIIDGEGSVQITGGTDFDETYNGAGTYQILVPFGIDELTFTAIATVSGWNFVSFDQNGAADTFSPVTYTIADGDTVTATFDETDGTNDVLNYTLTIVGEGDVIVGTATFTGPGTWLMSVPIATPDVTFEADANVTGWNFFSFDQNGGTASRYSPMTYTVAQGDTITATFEDTTDTTDGMNTINYTLTIVGKGDVDNGTDTFTGDGSWLISMDVVSPATTADITFTADPNVAGWNFFSFDQNGGTASRYSPMTYTVVQNDTITATFDEKDGVNDVKNITLTVTGNGSVAVDGFPDPFVGPGTWLLSVPDTVTNLKFTGTPTVPNGTVTFLQNGVGDNTNPKTFTIADGDIISAVFGSSGGPTEPKIYTITATADSGSTINPSGRITVQAGDSKTFTFAAKDGYTIVEVWIDGVYSLSQAEIDSGSYTFSNVMSNHTIQMKSVVGSRTSDITLTINIKEGDGYAEYSINGGSFTRYTGPVTLQVGDNVAVRAFAADGYQFAKWETPSVETNSSLSFNDVRASMHLDLYFTVAVTGAVDNKDGSALWIIGLLILVILLALFLLFLLWIRAGLFLSITMGGEAVNGAAVTYVVVNDDGKTKNGVKSSSSRGKLRIPAKKNATVTITMAAKDGHIATGLPLIVSMENRREHREMILK